MSSSTTPLAFAWGEGMLGASNLGSPRSCGSSSSTSISLSSPQLTRSSLSVTRTEKHNDRNHSGLADGTATPEDHLPRYFAKSGHVGEDPKKVKKEGGGKGNW